MEKTLEFYIEQFKPVRILHDEKQITYRIEGNFHFRRTKRHTVCYT